MDYLLNEVRQEAEERMRLIQNNYEAGKRDCENGVYDYNYKICKRMEHSRAYDIGWNERNAEVKNTKVQFLEITKNHSCSG